MSWGRLSRDVPSLATGQRPPPLVPTFPVPGQHRACVLPPAPPQTQARPAPDASLPPSHSTHLPVSPRPRAQPCPPSRLSHPAWLPPGPILGSQTLANTHTCSRTLTLTCTRVHGHSPTGRWQLTLWPRQVPRAGTTCRRSGKQASRKQSGSGFGGWSRKEGISCKR